MLLQSKHAIAIAFRGTQPTNLVHIRTSGKISMSPHGPMGRYTSGCLMPLLLCQKLPRARSWIGLCNLHFPHALPTLPAPPPPPSLPGRMRTEQCSSCSSEVTQALLGSCPCYTMRFGSTAKVLLKCKLKDYRISECASCPTDNARCTRGCQYVTLDLP